VAERLGADMPALPSRTARLYCSQHQPGRPRHPRAIERRARNWGWMENLADHGSYGFGSAERFGGLDVPGGALLGEAAGLVLRLPSFQGGLLGEA